MPRSGGVFTLVPGYFATDGTTIEVSQHNPPLEDIAQALTDSLPRDGSAPMTGNLPMGSNKITGLAAGTNPSDAVRFDQLPTFTPTTATLTAGTNAQGQGPITTDQVTITVAAANPSGATLPTAVTGDRVIIANRGANPVNIYPATGAAIGALAANAPVLLAVNQSVEFFARSATQWEGQISQPLDADLTAVAGLSTTGLVTRTAAGAMTTRQITSSDGSILITNPAGVAGDVNLSAGGLFFILNSGLTGANVTTAQDVLPLDVTLDASSIYEYELHYFMTKSAGTTFHTILSGFAGTATYNWVQRQLYVGGVNGSQTLSVPLLVNGYQTAMAEVDVVGGVYNSASATFWLREQGTFSVNAGGTIIPQYRLNPAPGGAWTVGAGARFQLRKLGASGANLSQGPWA